MPEINVELEKAKKRPARFSQRGCLLRVLVVCFALCGLCYASTWAFGRYGGAWVGSQLMTPVPGSDYVTSGSFQEGTIIFDWWLYAFPGSPEDVHQKFLPQYPFGSNNIFFCYDDCNAKSGLYWLYALSWGWSHPGRTYLDGAITSYCHVSHLYWSTAAFFEDMDFYISTEHYVFPDTLPADAVIQFMQACYYAN